MQTPPTQSSAPGWPGSAPDQPLVRPRAGSGGTAVGWPATVAAPSRAATEAEAPESDDPRLTEDPAGTVTPAASPSQVEVAQPESLSTPDADSTGLAAVADVSRETNPEAAADPADPDADVSRETSQLVAPPDELGGDPGDLSSSSSPDVSRETEPSTDDGDAALSPALDASPTETVSRETVTSPGGQSVDTVAPIAPLAEGVSRETAEPASSVAATASRALASDPPMENETWPRPDSCRVIAVANQKGGVGKTTSTVNVGAALAMHGLRVLIVDLDPQGNASTALSIDHREGQPSIYDVLVEGAAVMEIAQVVEAFPLLSCVPATIDVAGAEVELVSLVARETRLRKALLPVLSHFDYIFIDCPPSLGLLTINAFVAAREVMIPIQCEFYALEGLSQLLRNIELIRSHLNEDLLISMILLTMYDARTKLSEQVANDVREHFGEKVVNSVIPRSVRISEAPGFGQTVVTFDPASRGAKAYVAAARDMAVRIPALLDVDPAGQ